VGQYAFAHTLYSSVRPYGAAVALSVVDASGPQLYMIEPSGNFYGYAACAMGKGKQVAKTELEKLKFDELSVRDAIKEAARMHALYVLNDTL
jgi:20S proteasome subunit alpha 7